MVLVGASDDLAELYGAIQDEASPGSDGGDILLLNAKIIEDHDDCECPYCGFKELKARAAVIEALWCKDPGYSWTYRTSIPHASFDVMEDGEKYCRGIVFELSSIPDLRPKTNPS